MDEDEKAESVTRFAISVPREGSGMRRSCGCCCVLNGDPFLLTLVNEFEGAKAVAVEASTAILQNFILLGKLLGTPLKLQLLRTGRGKQHQSPLPYNSNRLWVVSIWVSSKRRLQSAVIP